MSKSLNHTEGVDQVLVRFLTELEGATDCEQVLELFSAQYPHRVAEFREMLELGRILDRSAEGVDESLPKRLGDFRIIRKIDSGGMGIVCEAIQDPLDRRVVVKIIRRGRTSPESRERFLREQRVLASMHQTHIVPVFAAGEEGPIQYFAMPHIDGVNLSRLIHTAHERESNHTGKSMPQLEDLVETAMALETTLATVPMPERTALENCEDAPTKKLQVDSAEPTLLATDPDRDLCPKPALLLSADYLHSVARIMRDVAESVHHAHERGFVHRDLKPSNIMVDSAGQSWLIDFGLARHVSGNGEAVAEPEVTGSELHAIKTVGPLGTPGYMAPEQRAGGQIGVWTDVWGLGATLYELSTLHRAYPRDRMSMADRFVCPITCRPANGSSNIRVIWRRSATGPSTTPRRSGTLRHRPLPMT